MSVTPVASYPQAGRPSNAARASQHAQARTQHHDDALADGTSAEFKKITGTFRLDIDEQGSWLITIANGVPSVTKGEGDADCVLSCSTEDFDRIMAGRQNLRRKSRSGPPLHQPSEVTLVAGRSLSKDPAALIVRLEAEADFADLFEVKDALTTKKGERDVRVEDNRLVFGYLRVIVAAATAHHVSAHHLHHGKHVRHHHFVGGALIHVHHVRPCVGGRRRLRLSPRDDAARAADLVRVVGYGPTAMSIADTNMIGQDQEISHGWGELAGRQ